MEGMLARVVIVNNNLDHLALLQDEGVRPFSVDFRVGGIVTAAERCEQCRDLWFLVGDVAEECIVGAVGQIVHDDGQSDLLIRVGVDGLVVVGNEGPVIELVERILLDDGCVWIWLCCVVYQPACDVPIQVIWDGVEQGLGTWLAD